MINKKIILVFILFSVMMYSSLALDNSSLIHYYGFEDNLIDDMGNENLSIYQIGYETDYVPGVIGKGVYFDGVSGTGFGDGLAIYGSSTNSLDEGTICYWLKLNDTSKDQNVFAKQSANMRALYSTSSDGITFNVNGGSSNYVGGIDFELFNFICHRWDLNNEQTFYNGIQVSNETTGSPTPNSGVFVLGQNSVNSNDILNGTYDEFSFWNSSISNIFIDELYNNGSGFNPLIQIIVPYSYNFSGGNGTINNPYLINNTRDFKEMINFSDKYFLQINNIDFEGEEIISINNGTRTTLKYDGGYYNLSNLAVRNSGQTALFGDIDNGFSFENILINNINISSTSTSTLTQIGTIYARSYGINTVNNIDLRNFRLSGQNTRKGGLFGLVSGTTISNISMRNGYIGNSGAVGLISGINGVTLNNVGIRNVTLDSNNIITVGFGGNNDNFNVNNVYVEDVYVQNSLTLLFKGSTANNFLLNRVSDETLIVDYTTCNNIYVNRDTINGIVDCTEINLSDSDLVDENSFPSLDFIVNWSIYKPLSLPFLLFEDYEKQLYTPSSVDITSPNGSYVLNSTGINLLFSYTQSSSNPQAFYDVYFKNGGLEYLVRSNTSLISFIENIDSSDVLVSGVYNVKVVATNTQGSSESLSSGTVSFCINNWEAQYSTCVNDTQIKTYTDLNFCVETYDVPNDNNSVVVCDDGIVSSLEIDERNIEFKENMLKMIWLAIIGGVLIFFYMITRSSLAGILTTVFFFLVGLYLWYSFPSDWIIGVSALIVAVAFGISTFVLNKNE